MGYFKWEEKQLIFFIIKRRDYKWRYIWRIVRVGLIGEGIGQYSFEFVRGKRMKILGLGGEFGKLFSWIRSDLVGGL